MRKLLHGIWVTELRSPDGATAMVADHGAHVLSWIPAGGEEALFLSEDSRYGTNDAIRGGVPVIFPQFGESGTGKRHGFARVADWRLDFAGIEQGRAIARYALTHQQVSGTGWPHQFHLAFEVALHGQQLQMTLSVHNPSDTRWEFNAALHTYLKVADVASVGLFGLQGLAFIDQVHAGIHKVQQQDCLRVEGEIDRIYLGTSNALTLQDSHRAMAVQQSGFPDVVVWNPGSEKAASLADLTPGSYRSFLCVEAAAVDQSIVLEPGAHWRGAQTLIIKRAT